MCNVEAFVACDHRRIERDRRTIVPICLAHGVPNTPIFQLGYPAAVIADEPRYCPSIEDKILRTYTARDQHSRLIQRDLLHRNKIVAGKFRLIENVIVRVEGRLRIAKRAFAEYPRRAAACDADGGKRNRPRHSRNTRGAGRCPIAASSDAGVTGSLRPWERRRR